MDLFLIQIGQPFKVELVAGRPAPAGLAREPAVLEVLQGCRLNGFDPKSRTQEENTVVAVDNFVFVVSVEGPTDKDFHLQVR